MHKDKHRQRQIVTPIHIAIAVLVVVSALLILGSYQYGDISAGEWFSGVLLDIGFIVLGLAIAFVIGERLVIEAENHRWQEVDSAVCDRAFRSALTTLAAFVAAPTMRKAIETGHGGPIPASDVFLSDLRFSVKWSDDHLLPVLKTFAESQPHQPSMLRADWNAIRSSLTTASTITTATVTLALPRDIPNLLSALLDLETAQNALSACLTADSGDDFDEASALRLCHETAEAAHTVLLAVLDQED